MFTTTIEEQQQYLRETYVLVSSYAPVYGLLSHNGRDLYIADGVNFRDYAYVLNDDGSSLEISEDNGQRSTARDKIRDTVTRLSAFYKFH